MEPIVIKEVVSFQGSTGRSYWFNVNIFDKYQFEVIHHVDLGRVDRRWAISDEYTTAGYLALCDNVDSAMSLSKYSGNGIDHGTLCELDM